MLNDAEKNVQLSNIPVRNYFLVSQMKVSSISMKRIQSDSISGSEVDIELDIL